VVMVFLRPSRGRRNLRVVFLLADGGPSFFWWLLASSASALSASAFFRDPRPSIRGARLDVMMMMMMQQYYHVVGDNRAFDAITTELEDAFLWSEQLPLWNLQFLRLLFQGLQPWSRQLDRSRLRGRVLTLRMSITLTAHEDSIDGWPLLKFLGYWCHWAFWALFLLSRSLMARGFHRCACPALGMLVQRVCCDLFFFTWTLEDCGGLQSGTLSLMTSSDDGLFLMAMNCQLISVD